MAMDEHEFTRADYDRLVASIPPKDRKLNPISEYEEIEIVPGCTLFDLYRPRRPPVTDTDASRVVNLRSLHADLRCPICLGLIKNCTVVKQCLHRFCKNCIDEALRKSGSVCPSCRVHLPSRRFLREDTNFDGLISALYPNRDELERKEDERIDRVNRERHLNTAATESMRIGVQTQETMRRNLNRKRSPPSTSASTSSQASDGASDVQKRQKTQHQGQQDKDTSEKDRERVTLHVTLHPEEVSREHQLLSPVFRTTYRLKIRHLKAHVAKLLHLSPESMHIVLPRINFEASGLKDAGSAVERLDLQRDQELEGFLTLYDVYQQYGMGTAWQLQLQYHFSNHLSKHMQANTT